nr:MAG TPA: hypothetical protein [Caudoviricetes sp.]
MVLTAQRFYRMPYCQFFRRILQYPGGFIPGCF